MALVVYTALTLAFKSGLLGLIPSFTMTLSVLLVSFFCWYGRGCQYSYLRKNQRRAERLARASAIEEGFKEPGYPFVT